MKSGWYYAYNLFVLPILLAGAYASALFNNKLREGLKDRSMLFEKLEESVHHLHPGTPRIWFHVSSLGEFEQAKPIIQKVKETYPQGIIIVTFFSPSGYRYSLNYKYADILSYMPVDRRRFAKKFVSLINPDIAVFVRYDIWPNHIWALAEAGIPIFLASATMREKSIRFYPGLKPFHRHLFNLFTAVLTVTVHDAEQFRRYRLRTPIIESVGDTRYDQVLRRSEAARSIDLLPEGFTRRKKVLVVGSSWQADEEHLIPALKRLDKTERTLLTILVPHEPNEHNLQRIEKHFGPELTHIRFSHLNNYHGEKVIIVDSIGILVTLYKYAHIAYIGGGFRSGVHNVLEAAVYGIPVVIGPRHANSQEAMELIKRKGGFVVTDQHSMYAVFQRLLTDTRCRKQTGAVCKQLVKEHSGATDRIFRHLKKYIPNGT